MTIIFSWKFFPIWNTIFSNRRETEVVVLDTTSRHSAVHFSKPTFQQHDLPRAEDLHGEHLAVPRRVRRLRRLRPYARDVRSKHRRGQGPTDLDYNDRGRFIRGQNAGNIESRNSTSRTRKTSQVIQTGLCCVRRIFHWRTLLPSCGSQSHHRRPFCYRPIPRRRCHGLCSRIKNQPKTHVWYVQARSANLGHGPCFDFQQ